MAKGKKTKKGLTQEEWLEQALVPKEDWPYEVPGNWCWTKVGAIASVKGGKRVPKGKCLVEYQTAHPYIRVTDFDNYSIIIGQIKYVDDDTFNEIHSYTISAMDIYISIAGTIGKVGIIPKVLDGANLTENAAKITDIIGVDQRYLLWGLASNLAQAQMRNATISTTQPKLALFRIENIKFPLAPFAEQQRIVDCIENLFAKLDKAKEKAQAVVDGFEQRKSAILHKAFTGELTAQWRKKNGHSISEWEECRVFDFCKSLKYGTAKKSKKEGSVVVVRMGNLQNGEIDWKNLAYTDDTADIKKYCLNPGDVLFNRTNSPELVGKTAIYRGEFPAIYAGYLIKLEYDETIIGGYLNYVLNSPQAKKYCNMVKTDGVNQSNINAKKIGAFKMLRPSIEEQMEIVRTLDDFFFKETLTKKKTEAILKSIDLTKKSILTKAFRGELGTNGPAEESAKELLEKVYMDDKG